MARSLLLACLATLAALACTSAPAPLPSAEPSSAPVPERAFAIERTNTPALVASGEERVVSLTLANLGGRVWLASGPNEVHLSYHWRGPAFVWDGLRSKLPADVPPGGRVQVVAKLGAPTVPGEYALEWDLVEEGVAWFGGAPALAVAVRAPESRVDWGDVRVDRMHAEVRAALPVRLRNAGNVTWPAVGDGAVRLSYHWRDIAGRVVAWEGERTALVDAVEPGASVQTALLVLPPAAPGRYALELDLVRDGIGWFGSTRRVEVDVAAPSRSATYALVEAPKRVVVGEPLAVRVALTNTGAAPWTYGGPRRARLAYHLRDAAGHVVLWDGPRTELTRSVAAGERIEVTATARAPVAPGAYALVFDLVQEGVGWFAEAGARPLEVRIEAAPVDGLAHFGPLRAPELMANDLLYKVYLDVTNVGTVPWPSGGFQPVRAAYRWIDAAGRSLFWDSPRRELEADVPPGSSRALELTVAPPERPGTYTLLVDLVQEGVSWFQPRGTVPARATVRVARPSFDATWVSLELPARLRAGAIQRARVAVRNDGAFPWVATGDRPVRVAHHWRDERGALLVWDGFRTPLDGDVAAGAVAEVEAWFFAPVTPGTYVIEWDLVQEDVAWFGDRTQRTARRAVEVVE